MGTNWREIDTCAKKWINEAGERIKASFHTELFIQTKSSRTDLVTNMDKEIEKFFKHKINEVFPTHKILGEEETGHHLEKLDGIVWIIDPIDGTMNFIHQQRNFAISIGVYQDGKGILGYIYDVVHNELYYAQKGEGAYLNGVLLPKLEEVSMEESVIAINASWLLPKNIFHSEAAVSLIKSVRGTRSFGSAALELASVATGRIDAYLSKRLAPWDYGGGAILIEEVGGIVTDMQGNRLDMLSGSSLLVARPGLHNQILKMFNSVKNP